jgi:FAD-dependent urate hydroxylase
VCLVGDAAHAMLPSAGQGASLAMEDALVLARCLRDAPDTERAFTIFEGLRKERVERIAAEARRNSGRKAPTNALTRGIRDLILPFFLKMSAGKAGEVYSYRVDWEEPAWPTGRDLAEGKLDMRGSHVKSP